MGLLQSTAANMLEMIGIGPFITIPLIIAAMGGPQAMIGWILGALIAICDGLVWAELGAAMPGSGGSYHYLLQAYGPRRWGRLMSFLFIWQTVCTAPFSIASGAVGFSNYTKYLWPGMTATQGKLLGIRIEPWKEGTLEDLESGELDLALYADDPVPGDFHTRDLFKETYGALMAKTHPLALRKDKQTKLQPADLKEYPQLVATYPNGRNTEIDDVLGNMGQVCTAMQAAVPYFLAAPWLLKDTDFVMLCPQRAVRSLAEHPAVTWLGIDSRASDFTYRMVWHERANKDVGLIWLRQLILKSLEKGA